MSGKNPLGQSKESQAYEGINIIVPVGGWSLVKSKRDATSNDKKYPVGSLWVNTVLNNIWILTSAPGNWVQLINAGSFILDVANGGTGVATLTAHGVVIGEGTSPVAVTAAGTNGQVIIAATGADPAFATVTSSNSSVTFTTGANALGLTVTQATTTQLGGAETATDAEAISAASTTVVLTPSNLAALTATNLAALNATAAQAQALSSNAVFITPADLASYFAGTNITFNESPILQSNATTGAAPSGATGAVNLMMCQGGEIMQQYIIGAGQTIIAPRMGTTGLLTSLDLTATEGAEYNFGINANNKHQYTIGTSPAFYIEVVVNAADVGGLDPFAIGFRREQANSQTFTDYTDFAAIGARNTTAADVIVLQTDLNNGGEIYTNTTNTWTDGQTKTLKVLVSGAGVVTYTIAGIAPVVTAAFTFDSGDIVTPFIRHEFGAATPGALNLISVKIGFQ